MTLIFSTLSFILGTCIGSFLGAINHRLYTKKKGFIKGRSICSQCKKQLNWYELFPLISYIFLKGKCSKCKKKISLYYPAIELTTGLTYLFLISKLGLENIPLISFYGIVFTLLVGIFFYDLQYQEIPDSYSLSAIFIATVGNIFLKIVAPTTMLIGALTIGGFFALQFFISRGQWIGGGDIRLGVLIGILLGTTNGAMALFIAYLFGSIIGILLIMAKKASRKTLLPFGPFLIVGLTITLFYQKTLIAIYQTLFLI